MSSQTLVALTSESALEVASDQRLVGMTGVELAMNIGTHPTIGKPFAQYLASNGKARDTGVVPLGSTIPPIFVRARTEFVVELVSALLGDERTAVARDPAAAYKFAEQLSMMDLSIEDAISSFGSTGDESFKQNLEARLATTLTRIEAASIPA